MNKQTVGLEIKKICAGETTAHSRVDKKTGQQRTVQASIIVYFAVDGVLAKGYLYNKVPVIQDDGSCSSFTGKVTCAQSKRKVMGQSCKLRFDVQVHCSIHSKEIYDPQKWEVIKFPVNDHARM